MSRDLKEFVENLSEVLTEEEERLRNQWSTEGTMEKAMRENRMEILRGLRSMLNEALERTIEGP